MYSRQYYIDGVNPNTNYEWLPGIEIQDKFDHLKEVKEGRNTKVQKYDFDPVPGSRMSPRNRHSAYLIEETILISIRNTRFVVSDVSENLNIKTMTIKSNDIVRILIVLF